MGQIDIEPPKIKIYDSSIPKQPQSTDIAWVTEKNDTIDSILEAKSLEELPVISEATVNMDGTTTEKVFIDEFQPDPEKNVELIPNEMDEWKQADEWRKKTDKNGRTVMFNTAHTEQFTENGEEMETPILFDVNNPEDRKKLLELGVKL